MSTYMNDYSYVLRKNQVHYERTLKFKYLLPLAEAVFLSGYRQSKAKMVLFSRGILY